MILSNYRKNVFINCPFDQDYKSLFYALIFAVHDCGYYACCAQEIDDSSTVRIDKLFEVIEACCLGIHDISRTELSVTHQLPRFNMPLELGLFLGAKRFGPAEQAEKRCLILDREPYRYQRFCSDIAGQDIQVHHQAPSLAIRVVRNWLASAVPTGLILPGGTKIAERYQLFWDDLPIQCDTSGLMVDELIFVDFRNLITQWLETNQW